MLKILPFALAAGLFAAAPGAALAGEASTDRPIDRPAAETVDPYPYVVRMSLWCAGVPADMLDSMPGCRSVSTETESYLRQAYRTQDTGEDQAARKP